MNDAATRAWRAVVCVAAGVASAFAGMLPWLVHGARLVPQNLWVTATSPAQMPVVLLPFSQYQLDLVAGVIVVGSFVAGLVARVLAARGVWGARTAVVAGLLIAQLVALIQTAVAVSSGLQFVGGVGQAAGAGVPDDAMAYVIAVCAWILFAIALGGVAFLLVTRASSAPLALGAALASVVLAPWVAEFFTSLDVTPAGSARGEAVVAMWLPAALLGGAIGWAGVRAVARERTAEPRRASAARIASAVAALLVLWLGMSIVNGFVAAAGSRALLRLPVGLAEVVASVIVAELRGDALKVTLAAALLGAVIIALREVLRRRSAAAR